MDGAYHETSRAIVAYGWLGTTVTPEHIHDASAQKSVNEPRQAPNQIQPRRGSNTPKGDFQTRIALRVTNHLRPYLNSEHEQRRQQYDADKSE